MRGDEVDEQHHPSHDFLLWSVRVSSRSLCVLPCISLQRVTTCFQKPGGIVRVCIARDLPSIMILCQQAIYGKGYVANAVALLKNLHRQQILRDAGFGAQNIVSAL